MANTADRWPNVSLPQLALVAAPSLVPPRTVTDTLLDTVVEYQHNPASLEFLEPSTSSDFVYGHVFHLI